MAITSNLLTVTLRYNFLNQNCQTARTYEVLAPIAPTVTAAEIGQAWWNDIKASWRGLVAVSGQMIFESVLVEEIGGSLNFGEYAIPVAEQQGTRPGTGLGEFLPPYAAIGVRLTVATRGTRPGQLRLPGVCEGDNLATSWGAAVLALALAVANKYSSLATLGAPALAVQLYPVVTSFAPLSGGLPTAYQRIVGNVINTIPTSQVSRRAGHGS